MPAALPHLAGTGATPSSWRARRVASSMPRGATVAAAAAPSSPDRIGFVKYQGLGNDFILVSG